MSGSTVCSCGGQNGGGVLIVTPGGAGVKKLWIVRSDRSGVILCGVVRSRVVTPHEVLHNMMMINEVLMRRTSRPAPPGCDTRPRPGRNGSKID